MSHVQYKFNRKILFKNTRVFSLTSKYSPSTMDISSIMSRLHLRHACADAGREAKSIHRCKPASPAPIPQNECNVTPPASHNKKKTANHQQIS